MLYGWDLSYFTGKLVSYLRYKKIAFQWIKVDAKTLAVDIKENTGEQVMPILYNRETKEWMQDTKYIIDTLELMYPSEDAPVLPSDKNPILRFAASLLEAWGDEFWVFNVNDIVHLVTSP